MWCSISFTYDNNKMIKESSISMKVEGQPIGSSLNELEYNAKISNWNMRENETINIYSFTIFI